MVILSEIAKLYAEQVMTYKDEILQNGHSFDALKILKMCKSFKEWINFEAKLKAKYKNGYALPEIFLAVILPNG